MQRVVIGNVRSLKRSPVRSYAGGERVVGYKNGYPVVLQRPKGRYVVDGSGAIRFEHKHDLGPGAQDAADRIEKGMTELKETVKALQQPAQRTAMIVGGVIAAGLVVAAIIYYAGRQT